MVLVPVLVGLALAAFAWPAARLAPREVPIGVVEQRLTGEGDAVEVHRFADQASARAAIAGSPGAGSPGAGSVWVVDVVASAGAGLVAVGVAQGWLGVLGGDWPVNAGGLGLTVLAVGATIAGLAALFGRAGVALGALLMVLVGNPALRGLVGPRVSCPCSGAPPLSRQTRSSRRDTAPGSLTVP